MSKPNHQIRDCFTEYILNIESRKSIADPFNIGTRKTNHPKSFYGKMNVMCEIEFGNTSLACEVREESIYNYSFSYLTDAISKRVLFRLDMGNGTHKNVAPDIPLNQSSVPTPHNHQYREDGRLLAYPIDGLDYDSEEALKFDLQHGYAYLCEKLSISTFSGASPKAYFTPEGFYTWDFGDTDPNQDVEFNI